MSQPITPADLEDLLALNNAHAVETSLLDRAKLERMIGMAFLARTVPSQQALLIAFDQTADYDSINFRWFHDRYEKFIYIDRIIVAAEARGGGVARALYMELFSAARTAGIRIVLAGARLSPRSERRWRRFPSLARAVWGFFDLVCVPEAEDVARFTAIGVAPERIRHTGSVKFDNAAKDAPSREAEFRALVQPLGFSGPLIVGGSTWAPEEQALADTLKKLRAEFPTLRLILVPRHVERAAAIADELTRAGLRVALRSKTLFSCPGHVFVSYFLLFLMCLDFAHIFDID